MKNKTENEKDKRIERMLDKYEIALPSGTVASEYRALTNNAYSVLEALVRKKATSFLSDNGTITSAKSFALGDTMSTDVHKITIVNIRHVEIKPSNTISNLEFTVDQYSGCEVKFQIGTDRFELKYFINDCGRKKQHDKK